MRNKNTCVRLMDKLNGTFQTLKFILSRPNADIQEFKTVIDDGKDIIEEVKRFLDREEESM